MNEIFGIPSTTIMMYLLALFTLCLTVAGWIWLRHRIVFRLGVRNIPRRPAQTMLIVVGLMLSTLIISAAFATGDTLDHSIRSEVYNILGSVDEVVVLAAGSDRPAEPQVGATMPEHIATSLRDMLAGNADVDGVMPVFRAAVPVVNVRTRLSEPALVMTGLDPVLVSEFGGLHDRAGRTVDLGALPSTGIVLGATPARKLDAIVGDQLIVYIGNVAHLLTVEAIDDDSPLTGMTRAGASGGFAMPLLRTQTLTGASFMISTVAVSNHGGVEGGVALSDQVVHAIDSALQDTPYRAVAIKQDGLDSAGANASLFVSMFLVFGLFSIAVGVLLIFLIFVMLAAERKPEMGMARAVGLRRRQLTQMFIAEGIAYDLVAALIGAALGVGVAFVMAGMLANVIGGGIDISPSASWRSVVIAYTLGIIVTFSTILISSWRISHLSIVQAIRDIAETKATRESRRWLIVGVAGLALSILLLYSGATSRNAFAFSAGASLIPLSLAALLRHVGLPARPVYSFAAVVMLLYWLMPAALSSRIFPETEGGIEMFFISGMMLVTAATVLIIWNAEVITDAVGILGRGFSRWLPAVRTAVAYPLSNRSRTGMTIAMFSLIVFSLVMMAALTDNIVAIFSGEHAGGGWDVRASQATTNPIGNFKSVMAENGGDADLIEAVGRVSAISPNRAEMRMAGTDDWALYAVNGVDPAFVAESKIPLQARADGYSSDRAVWDALATDPTLAVIDAAALPMSGMGFGDFGFTLDGISQSDTTMKPTRIEVSDPQTGAVRPITIIGIIDAQVFTMTGLFVSETTATEIFGAPDAINYYVRLSPGASSDDAARMIEASLINYGVQADSIHAIVDDAMSMSRGMMRLFEGFMALGLVVGIAALGVIAFRSVVERRQQIGMLRAIGFRRTTVAASFLIESTIITLLGVASGTILGLLVAWNLITSNYFIGGSSGAFIVPWRDITLLISIALGASLLMAYIPARRAASVPIAEALRYE